MKEKDKKFNLMLFALKHQKAAFITALVLGGIFVVYSLIFATPFFGLSFYSKPDGLMYAKGAEIYDNIQPFNKTLLNITLIQILFVAALFVFFCQKRRIYYLSNYISIGLYSLFSAFISIYTIINLIGIRIEYNKVDFEMVSMLDEITGKNYQKSALLIDAGVVLSLVALALSAFVIILAVAKYRTRKKELEQKTQKTPNTDLGEGVQNA